MKISGCSIEFNDGYISGWHRIVKNVFRFVGTYGLPLEVLLERLKASDITVDWMNYCTEALKEGHNPNTIKSRILEAVGDVYGAKYRGEVEKRLNILFS